MRLRRILAKSLVAFSVAVTCAAAPHARADAPAPSSAALETALAQDAQLASVGYQMALANRSLCPRQAPLPGFEVTGPVQYAPEFRDAFARLTGIAVGFGITRVEPGSPAAVAGLLPRDRLIAINGEQVTNPSVMQADFAPVAAVWARIVTAAKQGRLALTIERNGAQKPIAFVPQTGCDIAWQVVGGNEWAASTDGRVISVRSGLMAKLVDPSELAFIVGHELAHAIYGEPGSNRRVTGGSEARADVIGLYLAARAGYDPHSAVRLMERYGSKHPLSLFGFSHPSARNRVKVLRETANEIEARQAAGRDLWPNRFARPAG